MNAQIGRWDTPYSGQEQIPGLEPNGVSTLRIDVEVNDGGKVSFNYGLLTYDAGIYDWYDITMFTPQGSVPLVSRLGKPGSSYGTYWYSPPIPKSVDLTPYVGQHVYFVFSVQQDGWGDQTLGMVTDFSAVDPCHIPDLAQMKDPLALEFESYNGEIFKLSLATTALQSAYACLVEEVRFHGGTPLGSSAYRPPEYQSHLQEIWLKWRSLRNDTSAGCANRKEKIYNEAKNHKILKLEKAPAGPTGSHAQGIAVDMNWGRNSKNSTLPDGTNIDDLAVSCRLYRRLSWDPVHFEVF